MSSTDPEPQSELEGAPSLGDLITGLSRPEAFGLEDVAVEVVQTHISVVFLVGSGCNGSRSPRACLCCKHQKGMLMFLVVTPILGVIPAVIRVITERSFLWHNRCQRQTRS